MLSVCVVTYSTGVGTHLATVAFQYMGLLGNQRGSRVVQQHMITYTHQDYDGNVHELPYKQSTPPVLSHQQLSTYANQHHLTFPATTPLVIPLH